MDLALILQQSLDLLRGDGALVSQAAREAREQLEREWGATVCAICGDAKWANYPFCRLCSIRLQRAHLMRGILKRTSGYPVRRVAAFEGSRIWLRAYDRARDFLWNSGRRIDVDCS